MNVWVYIGLYLWVGLTLGILMAYVFEDGLIGGVTVFLWPFWILALPFIGFVCFFDWIASIKRDGVE